MSQDKKKKKVVNVHRPSCALNWWSLSAVEVGSPLIERQHLILQTTSVKDFTPSDNKSPTEDRAVAVEFYVPLKTYYRDFQTNGGGSKRLRGRQLDGTLYNSNYPSLNRTSGQINARTCWWNVQSVVPAIDGAGAFSLCSHLLLKGIKTFRIAYICIQTKTSDQCKRYRPLPTHTLKFTQSKRTGIDSRKLEQLFISVWTYAISCEDDYLESLIHVMH